MKKHKNVDVMAKWDTDLRNRAEEIARVAVDAKMWSKATGAEFARLPHSNDDLKFWEEALMNTVGRLGEPPEPPAKEV